MNCPYCGRPDSKVLDSRPEENGTTIRRRRECPACGKRFTTHEYLDVFRLLVIKKDGRREDFDRSKLIDGVAKACQKRPVTAEQIEHIVSDIESEVRENGDREISTDALGSKVLERLFHLDKVAYIRFASVYRAFSDLETFYKELNAIAEKSEGSDSPAFGKD